MLPNRERALLEIKTAAEMNPGPWEKHSENVARAAMFIADCGYDRAIRRFSVHR